MKNLKSHQSNIETVCRKMSRIRRKLQLLATKNVINLLKLFEPSALKALVLITLDEYTSRFPPELHSSTKRNRVGNQRTHWYKAGNQKTSGNLKLIRKTWVFQRPTTENSGAKSEIRNSRQHDSRPNQNNRETDKRVLNLLSSGHFGGKNERAMQTSQKVHKCSVVSIDGYWGWPMLHDGDLGLTVLETLNDLQKTTQKPKRRNARSS